MTGQLDLSQSIDTVRDVLTRLSSMFPKARADILAWSGSYQRVLGHLSPERLREVFGATVDLWEKGWPPRPADFAARVGGDSRPVTAADRRAGGENRALQDQTVRWHKLAAQLVDDSLAAYAKPFDDAAARIGVDGGHFRHYARTIWETGFSRSRASQAALAHVMRGEPLPDFLRLSEDDWQKLRRYAEARRDRPQDFVPPEPMRRYDEDAA